MWLRIPKILWGMLLRDLWWMLALTAAVLTAIVAFAAGVRPLADGQLDPLVALRFMALALAPMLQFTAPFAAGFAATLVYHRFATENEDLAAAAAGVSRRTVLMPAFGTGLALALVVGGLAHFVIPTFLRSMQKLVTRDVARVLMTSIERGESAQFNGLAVHADRAIRGEPDPARGVTDRLFLTGVVAFDEGEDGSIRAEVAAEHAEVLLTRERLDGEPVTVVRMRLDSAVGSQAGEGLGKVGRLTIGPWIVPDPFQDSPRMYTFFGLRELRRRPEINAGVDQLRRELAGALSVRRAERLIAGALAGEGRVALVDPAGARLVLWADQMRREDDRWSLAPADARPLTIDRTTTDGARQTLKAEDGGISITPDPAGGPAGVRLDLDTVSTSTGQDAGAPLSAHREFDDLRLADDAGGGLYDLSSFDLIGRADRTLAEDNAAPAVRIARDALSARIVRLDREILGNNHERFALASSCLLITLLGSIVALRLREGMPLHVYLWSFFPALGAVITISGGENVVPDNEVVGLSVLWGGVGLLALYTLIEYRRLTRH